MTLEEQSSCLRITKLYESLRLFAGSRSEVVVATVNITREIGLLLSVIMGPRNKWRRERYRKFSPHLPFGFDVASECMKVSLQCPQKVDAHSAARLFQVAVAIADDSPVERKPSKSSRAASPAVIVFNALHSARVTVDNRLKDFDSFDEVTQAEIAAMIGEHGTWIIGIRLPGYQRPSFDDQLERICNGALGQYVDMEINEDNY